MPVVKSVNLLWPQRCPTVADNGGLLATVGVKEEPVGPIYFWCEGQSRSGSAHVWRESPHDGIVASEAVAVVVVVHYGDFDSHAIEIHHTIDHARGLRCRNA